jgi:hypothetical protein
MQVTEQSAVPGFRVMVNIAQFRIAARSFSPNETGMIGNEGDLTPNRWSILYRRAVSIVHILDTGRPNERLAYWLRAARAVAEVVILRTNV